MLKLIRRFVKPKKRSHIQLIIGNKTFNIWYLRELREVLQRELYDENTKKLKYSPEQ